MKIIFHCLWMKNGAVPSKVFKSKETASLLEGYAGRIAKFAPCEVRGRPLPAEFKSGVKMIWWCDRAPRARGLASEETARLMERCSHASVQELRIFIGGPDGFFEQDERDFPPALRWSFGPLTLPHELACVVAAEQIYRAWTLLKGHPYHGGH